MTVLYMCPACEMGWGEPRRSPNCDERHCGRPLEEVKDKI